jgi:hypothetical protein
MMTASFSLTLPRLAQLAGGDLVAREVPAPATEREAFLQRAVGRLDRLAFPPAGRALRAAAWRAHRPDTSSAAGVRARRRRGAVRATPIPLVAAGGALVVVDDVTEACRGWRGATGTSGRAC